MTLRLIGLMSVLLFVALSTFSLLLSRSEDAIMREVERTISTAGSETLRAVLSGRSTEHPRGAWIGATADPAGPGDDCRSMTFTGERLEMHRLALVATQGPLPAGLDPAEVFCMVVPAVPVTVTSRQADELHFEVRLNTMAVDPGQCDAVDAAVELNTLAMGPAPADASDAVAAEGEALAAESEAATAAAALPAGSAGAMAVTAHLKQPAQHSIRVEQWAAGSPFPGAAFIAGRGPGMALPPGAAMEEFRFRMSTSHYQTLFEAVKKRMWMLFLAVFAVGSVCSIGLANRFTRPIRALDHALRRLAVDDLDVRVRESGSAEVGRLTRAFNQMAGRLRMARDRSRELARREKLSALGRLAAGVAHDVRNPLHSINLTMQHLCDTCRPADAAQAAEFDHAATLIHEEVRRLDRLVGNFLRFARRDAAETRPVRLAEMLLQTAELVAKEAENRQVRIEVEADPSDPEVPVGVESLRAALLNLVLNSLDAMRDGGTLRLRAWVEGERALIEVADTGVGIRAEDQERVFDFGFTTREDGHGLGLAMVHQIVVEEHAGRVSMTSRVGVGTTFRLELPMTAALEVVA